MTVIQAARLHTGSEVFAPGQLVVDAGRVVAAGPADGLPDVNLGSADLVPGFVDVHCHGGGGASFDSDPGTVLALHRAHGTTTMMASTVTQSLEVLAGQVRMLAGWVADGRLAGIHLEGPWLAERYKGAHPASRLRDPIPEEVARIVDAGAGAVRMVTIAAERTGGLETVRALADAGVVAALGHTASDYEGARAAIDAGVTGATHLFNAMPPLHHRFPGPVLALLADERVWLELIVDGVHVDLALVEWVCRLYPERVVFITDAMAAAGCADGDHMLGELPVEVRGGIARLAGSDTIAGSTLTLDAAVRNAVGAGVDWFQAIRSATVLPARYLGLAGVGELRPGSWADAVVLGQDLQVTNVLFHGAFEGAFSPTR